MIWKKFYLFSWPVIWIISFLWPRDLFLSSFSIKWYVPESLTMFLYLPLIMFHSEEKFQCCRLLSMFSDSVMSTTHTVTLRPFLEKNRSSLRSPFFSVSWGNKDMEFNLPFTQKTVSWTACPPGHHCYVSQYKIHFVKLTCSLSLGMSWFHSDDNLFFIDLAQYQKLTITYQNLENNIALLFACPNLVWTWLLASRICKQTWRPLPLLTCHSIC